MSICTNPVCCAFIKSQSRYVCTYTHPLISTYTVERERVALVRIHGHPGGRNCGGGGPGADAGVDGAGGGGGAVVAGGAAGTAAAICEICAALALAVFPESFSSFSLSLSLSLSFFMRVGRERAASCFRSSSGTRDLGDFVSICLRSYLCAKEFWLAKLNFLFGE